MFRLSLALVVVLVVGGCSSYPGMEVRRARIRAAEEAQYVRWQRMLRSWGESPQEFSRAYGGGVGDMMGDVAGMGDGGVIERHTERWEMERQTQALQDLRWEVNRNRTSR